MNNHPQILLPETVLAGRISVKHFPASCCRVIDSIFSLVTLFHHLLFLHEQKFGSLDSSLLRLFFEVFPPCSNTLVQYSKEFMGRESKAPLSTKPHGGKVALCLHQSKEKASVSCVPCTLMRYVPAARASCVAHNNQKTSD